MDNGFKMSNSLIEPVMISLNPDDALKISNFSLVRATLKHNSIGYSRFTEVQNTRSYRVLRPVRGIPRQNRSQYKPVWPTGETLMIRSSYIIIKYFTAGIYCPELLSYFNIYVPRCRTRFMNNFYNPFHKTV